MKLFRKLMDHFAKNPLTKLALVKRFREWRGGPMTDEEMKEYLDDLQEAAKKAKKRR